MASLGESGVTLIDCDHRTPPAASTGYPYVAIPQLKAGRIDLSDVRRISTEHFVEWTRKASPQPFDVVLSRRCNPGETAFVTPALKFALGQNLVLLRADGTSILPEFLRWIVRGPLWWEQVQKFLNVGAVFDSLRCADVPKFELPIPPLKEQRAIARILGALDDKIELNRKMNATLEAMARALFKSWFVDFDPVRAKAEGRAPSGMDAETAKLFPSEFVESELGLIPRGWESKALREGAELNPTRSLRKGALAPYVEMSSLPTAGHRPAQWPLREMGSGAKFQNGDTLLARITPCLENGKTGFVDFLGEGEVGWGSTEYIVIAPQAPLPSEWGYLLARHDSFRDFAKQKMEGSTGRQRVPADALGEYLVTVPCEPVAARFGELVRSWFQRMAHCHEQSSTLARIRDELLPRLLSGELSVAEVAREVEAVA